MVEKNVRSIRTPVLRSGELAGLATQKNAVVDPADPSDICSSCGGTGWKGVTIGHEKRVTRCECFLRSRADRLLELAAIPTRHEKCEFSNYKTGVSTGLAAAKIAVEKWAAEYPLDRTGLLLIGPSGVGKTHLSVAALKLLMKKGVGGIFCDYRELLKQIQNSYNPSVQATELGVLKPIFESDVVILDDLGAVKPSEWVWDTVSLVLNTRYNNNRTTIITANFEDGPARNVTISGAHAAGRQDTLGDRIGERMRSRLFEMCHLIHVDGKDYRERFRGRQSSIVNRQP
jgi:DNA replication protein DnaC